MGTTEGSLEHSAIRSIGTVAACYQLIVRNAARNCAYIDTITGHFSSALIADDIDFFGFT